MSSNIFLLRDDSSKVGAFVEIVPGQTDMANPPGSPPSRTPADDAHIQWGKNDNQPNIMHALATDNDVKWTLMCTKRDFIVGNGIRFGIEKQNGSKVERELLPTSHPNYAQIAEMVAAEEEMGYYLDTALQICFAGQHFTRLTLDLRGWALPLEMVDCFELRYRAVQANERRPTVMFQNGNFGKRDVKKAESVAIPLYNPADPQAFPSAIYHSKHRLPGQPFYAFAPWWGTRAWTEVANRIPAYHMNGLTNGYNIKYLIKIPDDYFDKEGLETEEQRIDFRNQVLGQMKTSLAGQTDRAVVTFYKHDISLMKALPGVEIIPLKNTMTDDAYIQLHNTAKESQASGHDIQLVLAGVNTGGKLGGSGKEMEVAANYQQKFRTYADRQLILRAKQIQSRINRHDPAIKYWFEDIEVYTPDVTPTNAGVNPNNKKTPDAHAD